LNFKKPELSPYFMTKNIFSFSYVIKYFRHWPRSADQHDNGLLIHQRPKNFKTGDCCLKIKQVFLIFVFSGHKTVGMFYLSLQGS